MFDLKVINAVLEELQEQKGISKEEVLEAIEESLASAYKKQYGERGQIIRAKFNPDTGDVDFFRIKEVVSPEQIISEEDFEKLSKEEYLNLKEEGKTKFIEERHIFVENAKLVKAGVEAGDEITFELEKKTDFGRVAAMAAKQTIKQKIREAERGYIQKQFGDKEQTIVSGQVIRSEAGTIFVDLGKVEGVLPFFEQIKSERYKTGDRVQAYLVKAGEKGRGGVELLLSRTHPEFLKKLFEQEVPEIKEGLVEIKKVVREPGVRSKIAVVSHDEDLDPVGTFVGQSGARVSNITSELSGERIDIIEWSEEEDEFVAASLSPAEILDIEIVEDGEQKTAIVSVTEDQFSLAIGRGGQNSRLASKLTGMKIDIKKVGPDGEELVEEKRETKNVLDEKEKEEGEESGENEDDTKEVEENVEEKVEIEKDVDKEEDGDGEVEEKKEGK